MKLKKPAHAGFFCKYIDQLLANHNLLCLHLIAIDEA